MDAFLRHVLERRELEQEAAIIALPVAELAARHCEKCGVALNMSEDPERQRARHFCFNCGGLKADAQLERELAAAAARRTYVNNLLALAGVPTTPEKPMAEENKSCPHCDTPMRSNNTRGVCTTCWKKGLRAIPGELSPRKAGAGAVAFTQTRKKFRVITEALGIDGEWLLQQFMEGWLAKIRVSVRPPEEEEIL